MVCPKQEKRVFVIGVKKKFSHLIGKIYEELTIKTKEKNTYTVKDAIVDLPKLKPGEGKEKIKIYKWQNK